MYRSFRRNQGSSSRKRAWISSRHFRICRRPKSRQRIKKNKLIWNLKETGMSRKVRTFFLNKLKKKQGNLTVFLRVQDKKGQNSKLNTHKWPTFLTLCSSIFYACAHLEVVHCRGKPLSQSVNKKRQFNHVPRAKISLVSCKTAATSDQWRYSG